MSELSQFIAKQVEYEKNRSFIKDYNELQLMLGNTTFMKMWFSGPDGVYYDAIGDEIFSVKRIIGSDLKMPEYILTFSDLERIGTFADHGFNEYLGEL